MAYRTDRICYSLLVIAVWFMSLPLGVTAQTPTTSQSVSDPAIEPFMVVESEPWYRLETISGQIDTGDFVVGPGKIEIEAAPGQTVVREISLTNRISNNRSFALTVEDISGSTDGSAAVKLAGPERGPYSIQDFISYPEDELTLNLGERARLPITITVPADAEPGGYYGSVLISTVQSQGSADVGAPRSPIIARVGSLFFLRVTGEAMTAGETKEITTVPKQVWYEQGPINFGILYENSGSVHVNPYGELSITNMFGEEVGYVELEPWFVLPTSLRLREILWDREFLFGRYTAIARVNRGYEDIIDEVQVSFWVLPWKMVTGIFLVIFVISFSIRAFFRTFEFKRKGY